MTAGQAEIKALEQSIFSLAQQHAPSSAESSRPASTPTSQPPMDAQKAQSQPAQATSARATVPSRSEDHQGAGSSVNGGVGGMQRKVGEEGSRERGKPEENAGSDTRVPEEVRAALQGALEQAEEEARRAEEAGDVGGLWRCKRRVAFLVRRSVRIRNRDGAEAAAARLARIGDSIHALFLHSVRGSAPGRSPLGNDRAPSTGPGTRAVGGVTEGESGPPRASIGAGVTAGAPFGGSIAQGVEVGHSAPRAQPALAWTDVASQSASWTAGAQYGAAQHAATQHAAAQHAAAQHAAAQHAAATTTVGATGVAARGEAMARAHSQAKDAGTGAVARGEATVRAARESMSAGIPARESVGDPSLAAAMSLHTEDEEDANMCIVCMEKERCVTLVPCGHRIACLDCAKAWYRKKGTCPYCGGTIQRMTHDEDGWIEFNCWGV